MIFGFPQASCLRLNSVDPCSCPVDLLPFLGPIWVDSGASKVVRSTGVPDPTIKWTLLRLRAAASSSFLTSNANLLKITNNDYMLNTVTLGARGEVQHGGISIRAL